MVDIPRAFWEGLPGGEIILHYLYIICYMLEIKYDIFYIIYHMLYICAMFKLDGINILGCHGNQTSFPPWHMIQHSEASSSSLGFGIRFNKSQSL